MTHEQFKKAADYWKNKEMTAMPKEELKKAVEEYIIEEFLQKVISASQSDKLF